MSYFEHVTGLRQISNRHLKRCGYNNCTLITTIHPAAIGQSYKTYLPVMTNLSNAFSSRSSDVSFFDGLNDSINDEFMKLRNDYRAISNQYKFACAMKFLQLRKLHPLSMMVLSSKSMR